MSTTEAVSLSAPVDCSSLASHCPATGDAAPAVPEGPINLSTLLEEIRKQIAHIPGMHLSKRLNVKKLLELYEPSEGELDKFLNADESKPYSRNLVYTDNKTFTALLLVWNPNKGSPIHDHPGDGCWLKVCEGTLVETLYNVDELSNKLLPGAITTANKSEVVYIDDSLGLHKIENPLDIPAVSLHIYSPPFTSCCVWLDEAQPANAPLRAEMKMTNE